MLNKNHGDHFFKKTKEKSLRKKIVLPLILIFIFAFGGVAGAAVTLLTFDGRNITNKEVKPAIDKLKTKIDAYEANEQAHINAYDELYAQSVSRIQDARSIINNLRKDIDTLNQTSIDHIIDNAKKKSKDLFPKGIQERTLRFIMEYLNGNKNEWFTGDDIAAKVGLTGVTVRRYMNYLAESGRVAGEMNYETGGRPCMKYKVE